MKQADIKGSEAWYDETRHAVVFQYPAPDPFIHLEADEDGYYITSSVALGDIDTLVQSLARALKEESK